MIIMPKEIGGRMVPNFLMCGTGEYTTGWVGGKGSTSDKKKGVVGLVLFDQRRLGYAADLSMVGTNGTKFPAIRNHLQTQIGNVYRDMNVTFTSFPADDAPKDPKAYLAAMDTMQAGDGVVIFTPDNTHHEIAKAAIERGLHVLLTKPPVKTLEQHLELVELAKQYNVLVDIEVHKRFDPMYADARQQVQAGDVGDFTYFQSYMAQPKSQLDTFRAWLGKKSASDISYYLNSHHIDWHVWAMENKARPVLVSAAGATGIASGRPYNANTEDMITLLVRWESLNNKSNRGIAVYTAGWVEPPSEVHTRQGFTCMMHERKVEVDQSRRGYWLTGEGSPIQSVNPLYMKYTPDEQGFFAGQHGYGYLSIAEFVKAVGQINNGEREVADFERTLPTIARTLQMTAILEAGRRSLDNGGIPVSIDYNDEADKALPTNLIGYGIGVVRE